MIAYARNKVSAQAHFGLAGGRRTDSHTQTVGLLEGEEASPTRADIGPANQSWPESTTQTPTLSTMHAAREGKQCALM